jgi:two-component system, NarL family, nitrate/nitrite response regulator NarL
MPQEPIRVLVVDDHPIVGEGVARLTNGNGIELLACVATVAEAASLAALEPDVVLLDLRLGTSLSSSSVSELRRALPGAQVAIFTAFPEHVAVNEALGSGAAACLVKDIGQTDLVAALHALARGERPPAAVEPAGGDFGLSRQERAILLHVARGKTNAEIAGTMYLAPNTVKTYWQSALGKLNARNRAEAIMRAHAAGLL